MAGRPGPSSAIRRPDPRSAAAAAEGFGEDNSSACICGVLGRRSRGSEASFITQNPAGKHYAAKTHPYWIPFYSPTRREAGAEVPASRRRAARATNELKTQRVSLAKIRPKYVRETHNRASVLQNPKLRIFCTRHKTEKQSSK